MSKQFYFKQLSLRWVLSLVLFDPLIRPNKVQPLWSRVNLGAMALKEYSAFSKAPALLESHYHIVLGHIRTLAGEVLPHCRDAVYSTAPADWAMEELWSMEYVLNSNTGKTPQQIIISK